MSDDYLAAIMALEQAWTAAHALLCQRVNAFLRERKIQSKELPVGQIHEGLTFDAAIGRLKVAIHRLNNYIPVPANCPWLIVGALPVGSAAEADYRLECCAGKLGKNDTLDASHLIRMESAEKIRTWLASEKAKAAIPPATNPNDARDKFCYDKMASGKTRAWIRNHLSTSWEPLNSEQGVSAAAKRYAERRSLPWPIQR